MDLWPLSQCLRQGKGGPIWPPRNEIEPNTLTSPTPLALQSTARLPFVYHACPCPTHQRRGRPRHRRWSLPPSHPVASGRRVSRRTPKPLSRLTFRRLEKTSNALSEMTPFFRPPFPKVRCTFFHVSFSAPNPQLTANLPALLPTE